MTNRRNNQLYQFIYQFTFLLSLMFLLGQCSTDQTDQLIVKKGDTISFIGGNLCSRALNYGDLETAIQIRYPDEQLSVRNLCDGGDRPGFRPHSGRNEPWAFSTAMNFQEELANKSGSVGHLDNHDTWLNRLETDIILAFFGYSESFGGEEGLPMFKSELQAFVEHTLSQQYNGDTAPQLVLLSPVAFEDLSDQYDLPNGDTENENLAMYTAAIEEVATQNNVRFVDLFTPSSRVFSLSDNFTIDGFQLNEKGNAWLANTLTEALFKKPDASAISHKDLVKEAVLEKDWFWHNDFKIPNGVHVFGRRYEPFGPDNYPAEIKKIREMTEVRDQAIWAALKGEKMDLATADAKTSPLPPVETNYKVGDYGRGDANYLYGDDALASIKMAPGFKLDLFASEEEFPDLANPVQLSFDNQGRLWVAVMPTYPHWKPGDPKPNDKLLILEDTDQDGKADKQTVFAEGLHLPVGFEFAPEGVYVSQGTNLKLFTDTDGDDKADKVEIILSGFDDHDTHHVISAFCADPSGALYMAEGVFLHTNVETSYGTVRGTNGGFYRYNPQRKRLERTAQLSIPNPWGIAFDRWGQNFFAETSGPDVRWMMPGSVKSRYGRATHKSYNLIEEDHRVRPTSGLEFVSSRHFPEEMQGDMLINNAIGFLGTKQHQMIDEEIGYSSKHRQDLLVSDDTNFRPVDMEFAPDGSLYLVDWHNVLVGHMQHNARDPLRDHVHGRIYRITYPSRPLVEPAQVAGASIETLLDNLKLPEYRTRYRSRRELRGRDQADVLSAVTKWVDALDAESADYEHQLLEALWVTWGMNQIDQDILAKVLKAKDYKVRAAGVRVLRYTGHQVDNQVALLQEAALDPNGRVRLEAITAASWLDKEEGLSILAEAGKLPMGKWIIHAYRTAEAHLNDENYDMPKAEGETPAHLSKEVLASYERGREIYQQDGYCGTCHQPDGKGLASTGYPSLHQTQWVLGSEERLIKLSLKGLYGPIEVLGKSYDPKVPMTAFGGLLDDQELADVLNFVRNSFGNKSAVISAGQVAKVRASIEDKKGFYSPAELLEQHPLESELQ